MKIYLLIICLAHSLMSYAQLDASYEMGELKITEQNIDLKKLKFFSPEGDRVHFEIIELGKDSVTFDVSGVDLNLYYYARYKGEVYKVGITASDD